MLCAAHSSAQVDTKQELLQFVLDAHRSARESIRTVSCNVEFSVTITPRTAAGSPIVQSSSGKFWISKKAMRAEVNEGGDVDDHFWENSVHSDTSRRPIQGQPAMAAGRAAYTHRHCLRCDPVIRGLLVLNNPGTLDYMPFEELLNIASKAQKTERVTVNGTEFIVVHLVFDPVKNNTKGWTGTVYFDPRVNYLIRKVVYSHASGELNRTEEVVTFKDCQSGIFFPESISSTSENSSGISKLSDIKVNEPLPKDIFQFRYPDGVIMTDSINGTQYRVDAEGRATSTPNLLGHDTPPPAKNNVETEPGTETKTEPLSVSRYILPLSVCVLFISLFLVYIRRRRIRATES
jgi:outer membrane lipoprotein-sorting protein